MKKILFLMRYPLNEKHHLKQKFDGQMKACVNLGYDVFHFGYDDSRVYLVNYNSGEKQAVGSTHFRKNSKYRNSFGFLDLFSAMKRVSKKQSFDYIYMRSKIMNWTSISALKHFKKNGSKIVVEIPSYQSDEKTLSSIRKVLMFVANTWNRKLPPLVDLYTLIGPDGGGKYRDRPAINIENGICLDTIPMREYKEQKEIHLLALASMRKWHAYDRLIKGLGEYKGNKDIVIDMVGGDNDGSLLQWKELTKSYGLEDKVVFHGPKFGDELTEMFEICDAGIATLGLHRNGIMVGSVLKVREYMSRGLPFVYGYEDVSVPDDFSYALRVDANDDPVDMEKIVTWVMSVRSAPDVSLVMRKYAQDNMSWESIFKNVINRVDL